MSAEQSKQTAPNGGRNRRKQYVIDRPVQWKYTGLMVLGVVLISSLLSVLLFGVLNQQARDRVLHAASASGWENTLTIIVTAGAFAVVMAVAFGIWTMLATHRICGPIYVMQGLLAELTAGRFPRRRPLRTKDEFKDFYDTLWRALDTLKDKQRTDLERLTRILHAAQQAGDAGFDQRGNSLDSLITQVQTMRHEIADYLGETLETTDTAAATSTASSPAYAGLPT
ncbi:MAG: hypothetical protein ACYS7M_13595 [Planctomycetota bacterium]|jgi:hypothetical protein